MKTVQHKILTMSSSLYQIYPSGTPVWRQIVTMDTEFIICWFSALCHWSRFCSIFTEFCVVVEFVTKYFNYDCDGMMMYWVAIVSLSGISGLQWQHNIFISPMLDWERNQIDIFPVNSWSVGAFDVKMWKQGLRWKYKIPLQYFPINGKHNLTWLKAIELAYVQRAKPQNICKNAKCSILLNVEEIANKLDNFHFSSPCNLSSRFISLQYLPHFLTLDWWPLKTSFIITSRQLCHDS